MKTTGKCGPLLLGFSPVRIPDALNNQIFQNNKVHMALVIYLCCLLLKLIGAFVTVFIRNFRFITRLSKYLREQSCFYRSSAPDFLASILVFFLFLGLSNPSTVENATALASNSGDDNFFLASFDQLQKDSRIQCEKIGNYKVPFNFVYSETSIKRTPSGPSQVSA